MGFFSLKDTARPASRQAATRPAADRSPAAEFDTTALKVVRSAPGHDSIHNGHNGNHGGDAPADYREFTRF